MILLISTCKEKLHEEEFVRPIVNIVGKNTKIVHYTKLIPKHLREARKVIICGTALADFDYVQNLNKFSWIQDFDKPLFGICSGMQVLALVFGAKLKKKTAIGFETIHFTKPFLGKKDKIEVYQLHHNAVEKPPKSFDIYSTSKSVIQAIKHKTKPFYGVLFHPEVRNKDLIEHFISL